MMIKTLSLKQKILLSVVIALSLVIMLLSWQSYSAQKTLLIQESQDQARQLGQQEAKRISDWLLVRQDIIQALSNKASTEPLDALQQAQVSGRFQLTYFGENNGAMHDSDPGVNRTGYDPRSRGWYQDAMRQQGAVVTKPYLDVAYNVMVVTLAQPTQGGVVGGDLSIASLIDSVINMTLPAQGFAIMTHKEGNVIAYKNAEKAMQLATEIDSKLTRATINQSKSSDHLIPVYFDSEDRNKLLLTVDIPQTEWELLLVLDKAALEAPLSALLIRQLGLTMLVLIGSTLLISWLLNTLLGPLVKVSQALARIADGNGDLTQRIDVDSRDEVGQLANCFNRFVGSQHQLISNIRQLANELNADAERSLVLNQAAVEELQRQQQEVTLVATAVTEMASATMEIAGNAEQTAAAAQQSAHSSEQGKMRVNKTLHSVKGLASEVGQATEVIGELSRYAQAITSILSTIQGIAEQTNLLALNAAIEAARAGEQGRGFAVVADEVRVLSRRTQDSTQQIQSTIETLQQTTARAVNLMQTSQGLANHSVQDADQAVQALEEITHAISLISGMADQIATAAEEQTQVTGEITQNTTAIKDVTDEITAAAMRDLDQAQHLKARASSLNQQVATFIL
ncbi:MAG: methyl-accepting chemotaxis protein [Plesiomonas sp.]